MLTLLNLLTCSLCFGSRFAKEFRYAQPDGTVIRLWGEGDDFHAVFETLDGYTVLFVPETRTYCYARVSAALTALESTGVAVGQDDPAFFGLVKHQRLSPEATRLAASANYATWDRAMRMTDRWNQLKARNLGTGPQPLTPPPFQTIGTKCGITVLIDFEDQPAEISREEVCNFLNGDNYMGFGNNGSVKQYYTDNSNGTLTFTNIVTPYITIPNSVHPRSFYNDPTKDCFAQCQLLIRDALNLMKRLPNFTNDFLPLFQTVTVDSANKVASANFFVAGGDSGVWAKGIWGQTSALSYSVGVQSLSPGGRIVDRYQLSEMSSALTLYVFCHENGHLLCGFPDLYDYGYDSVGGAGDLCLMDYPPSLTNPSQFCAYLKTAAGWATVTDLLLGTNLVASLSAAGPDLNHFYRFRKQGVSTEYFLLENRQRVGHDAEISGGGIAVWHIDELGDRDNQSLATNSSHLNAEVTLVQADNRWDLERYQNRGDAEDYFLASNPASGYANAFSDLTSPSARWWNGARSGLSLTDFSTNAETMTFTANVEPTTIIFDPTDLTVYEGQRASFSFRPGGSNIQWYKDGAPLLSSDRITGTNGLMVTISPTVLADAGGYTVVSTYASGTVTSRVAQLTVKPGRPLLSTNLASVGGTTLLPAGVELTSSGTGIGGVADYCQFAYQSISGDFDARVRLLGISTKGTQTRVGLMVRAAVSASSPQLSVLTSLQPEGQPCLVLGRFSQGTAARELVNFLAPNPPIASPIISEFWLRLKREGNRFTAYRGTDGTNWVWLQSTQIELGADAFIGMTLTAGAGASGPASASFRNFAVLTNTPTTLAIFKTAPVAQEGTRNAAQVAVYASGNGPLQASLHFGGAAVYGGDYVSVPTAVSIPAGTNVALVTITPINNDLPAWPKTVEISLVDQPGIELTQPAAVPLLILDDEQPGGGLRRELYLDIGGIAVSDLARQMTNLNARTEVSYVTSFETPTNATYYGELLSGYLVPPETGNYVFYVASDENSELWLSTDETSANSHRIASVNGYAHFRDYSGSANHSAPIALEQGKYYYVKALHKQNWGPDCFSIAWQTPGASAPTNGSSPIPGTCLVFSLPAADGLALSPQAASFSPLMATGTVAVACTGDWTAQSLDSWIELLDATNGTGNGTLIYRVGANSDPASRVGTIEVNGRTHSVIQDAAPAMHIGLSASNSLQLVLNTTVAQSFVLEASNDLLTWEPIWTNALPATLDLASVDPASAQRPVRFYRAVTK